MGKLIRALAVLILLGLVGLVGYAYLGPIFGADFSAPQSEQRIPLTLNAD